MPLVSSNILGISFPLSLKFGFLISLKNGWYRYSTHLPRLDGWYYNKLFKISNTPSSGK